MSVLQRELGAEPEKETRDLYQEMLRHRPGEVEPTSPRPGRIRPGRATNPVGGSASKHRADIDVPTPPPLIGRDAELSQLRAALDGALAGRGQVVILVGEAGIGKTSVMQTLASEAARRDCGLALGRSHETEQILPFGPWVDAFRAGHVVVDEAILGALAPVWRGELVRLFPELEAPELPPSSDDQRPLFESVTRLVEQAAAIRPLVVLLEDLHWADEMSLRLLSFLGRRLQAWPVLVMATAREEELADATILRRALQELRRESHVTEVRLAPLSAPDTASLVRSLTRTGSDREAGARLEERIWRVSEGNPFVVVETLRALGEGTALASTSLPLPERVREVVAGRLEKLSDLGRQLTAVAAVIGRDFDFALLVRASRLADSDAAAGVEELVRRHVLHGVGEGFDFTHDRIREVAYGQVLPPRRKLLHGHVASALEEMHATDLAPHAAALGRHCQQAEKWDKAADYLHQAGVRANGRLAYREATTLLEAARAALAHLPESADTLARSVDLRFDLRNALQPRAEFERVCTELQEAERIAARLGDRRRGGQALVYLTNHSFYTGKFALAVDYGRRAAQLGDELGDLGTRVVASNYLAQAYTLRGEYAAAIELARRSMTLHTGDLMRDRFGQAMLPAVSPRLIIGRCLAYLGDVSEAVRSATEGLELARAADHPLLARTGSPESILAQLGARVWDLSGGNPFVAVEAVRGMADLGSTPLPATLPLPERVRQVIGRRLDSLQQGSRTLAKVAAVIGREFTFALAQRASGLEPEDAAAAVEELVRKRLLHGVGDRFDFTHDRIREAIRERLIAPRRQVLHAAVGRALERHG